MKHTIFFMLNRFDKALVKVLEWVCIALFAAITILLVMNIIVRFVPVMSMHWFDEILELLYAALIFYGATAVWVTNSHFRVGDWITKYLRNVRMRFAYRLLVEILSLVFILVFFKYALDLTMSADERTTVFAMPRAWLYSCMPISGGIMVLYSLKNMYLELAKIVNPGLDIDDGKEDLNH
ncbi:MAG: TRAP transporter small permease [Formivibrio sp.]|nr:TRAP transporter small permease [Formivibrio sp.]